MTSFFALSAIGTVLVSSWQFIRSWIVRIYSLFIVTAKIEAGDTGGLSQNNGNKYSASFVGHLRKNYKYWVFGPKVFATFHTFVPKQSMFKRLLIEKLPDMPIPFWIGYWPIFVSAKDKNIDIWFIRGTIDLDKLLMEALDYEEELFLTKSSKEKNAHNRYAFYTLSGSRGSHGGGSTKSGKLESPSDTVGDFEVMASTAIRQFNFKIEDLQMVVKKKSPFENLFLPKEFEIYKKKAERWLKSAAWFKEREIPHTRGWLLYGPGGTGKSSLVSALGWHLNLPVCRFDLSSMNNAEFTNNWETAASKAPVICLFEDFDAVFKGRENITATEMDKGLTFDHLLNTISGVQTRDGMFTIITTNHLSCIDPAIGLPDKEKGNISTRPGRIDEVIEMPAMDDDCRRRLVTYILSDFPDQVEGVMNSTVGFTGAQVKYTSVELASKLFWEREDAEIVVEPVIKRDLSADELWDMVKGVPISPPSNDKQSVIITDGSDGFIKVDGFTRITQEY